jgi:hypothetical protein
VENATFTTSSWDENTTREFDGGAKITNAKVEQSYDGEMQGVGNVEYQMAYATTGQVQILGLEVFDGAVAGRSGTIVLQHDGIFKDGAARSSWTFIEGTGTGDLLNLRGSGSYESIDDRTCRVSFEYIFGD